MKISSEFSKYALEYDNYNVIQNRVIKHLLSKLSRKPRRILDLGCGRGGICSEIDWDYDYFLGVDFAQKMLELHPKSSKIELFFEDFNNPLLFDRLATKKFDFIFSASALQWSKDLEEIFKNIKSLNAPFTLAIFSANTFKTINKTANITSILKSSDYIKQLNDKYLNAEFEVINYNLEFESTRDMFRYIKKSGVSASRGVLSYKESKRLLKEYPLSYLEFEVCFLFSDKI